MEMDGSRIIVRTYHMFSLSLNFLFVIVFFQEKKTVILALWNLGILILKMKIHLEQIYNTIRLLAG